MKKALIIGSLAVVLVLVVAVAWGANNRSFAPGGGKAGVVEKGVNNGTPPKEDDEEQTVPVASGSAVYDTQPSTGYAQLRVEGALNLPLSEIEKGVLPSESKDKPLYVYCNSETCSARAVALLKQAGFTQVTDMGSFSGVRAYGYTLQNLRAPDPTN